MNSFLKKSIIVVAVLAALAAGIVFGPKAYRRATERRLLGQARQYLARNDEREAALCLQRALQINPLSWETADAVANMLDTAGAPFAVNWRVRAAQLKPRDSGLRLAWARTALGWKDLVSASNALSEVQAADRDTEAYHSLMGALEWASGNGAEAAKDYNLALRFQPGNPAILLNLATIDLASTNGQRAAAARVSLQQIAGATNEVLATTALRYLSADAESRKAYGDALKYSAAIVNRPKSTFADKLAHLNLLEAARDVQATSYLNALKQEAAKSAPEACAMQGWLSSVFGSEAALGWLESLPRALQTNAMVEIATVEVHAARRDWSGLLALAGKESWGDLDYYRFSLEALAQKSAGQATAATGLWERAVHDSSHHLDRLTRLARLTAEWKWNSEQRDVLRRIATDFPHERWATEQLVLDFYVQGDTRGIQDFLAEVEPLNPSDVRLKNDLASVCLLRKDQLSKAYRLAREAYDSTPSDPFVVSTYAYALLMQNKTDDALNVVKGLKSEQLRIPAIAAYYGVIEARAGHKDLAKEPLARAAAAPLLPEEKELVRQAMAL